MTKLTKNQKSVAEKIEAGKAYTLKGQPDGSWRCVTA